MARLGGITIFAGAITTPRAKMCWAKKKSPTPTPTLPTSGHAAVAALPTPAGSRVRERGRR